MYTHLFKIPSKFSTPSGEVILTGYILVDQKEKEEKEKSRSKVCNDFVQFRKEKERKKFKNLQKKIYRIKKKVQAKGKIFDYNLYLKKAAAATQKIVFENMLKKKEKFISNVQTEVKSNNQNVKSKEELNTAIDKVFNSYLIPKKPKSVESYQLEMFTKHSVAAQQMANQIVNL